MVATKQVSQRKQLAGLGLDCKSKAIILLKFLPQPQMQENLGQPPSFRAVTLNSVTCGGLTTPVMLF